MQKSSTGERFMIINFYCFVFIKDLEAGVANPLSFLMVCSQILLFSLFFLLFIYIYIEKSLIIAQFSSPCLY
jgi:hypothetical protein